MGTRDLVVAGVITISFIVLITTLFNENSDYCILPIDNNSSINKEDYEMAKQLVSKYENDNKINLNPMNGINNINNNNMNNMNNNMNNNNINNMNTNLYK